MKPPFSVVYRFLTFERTFLSLIIPTPNLWAVDSMPREIMKSKERYGVYMGIINMMIVIPMIIQNLSFGYILKNFLDNDPRQAISFAGVLLVIAAFCTLLIKIKKTKLSE